MAPTVDKLLFTVDKWTVTLDIPNYGSSVLSPS